ncbi:MAG: 5-formyltetrahydrofolate cyclo-ligase [Planctomycetota bacterium]
MTASEKQMIRRRAHAARAAQPDRDAVSRRILRQVTKLPEYQAAHTVLFYVDIRDEVRTRFMVRHVLTAESKVVVVPWCAGRRLKLFRLTDWAQLEPGYFDVLEPKAGLRGEARHMVAPRDIDTALIPGVAFDPTGARIGHGHGFYDRLLAEFPLSTALIGLAYECQVFPPFAMESHDVGMDRVVTESRVYVGLGRSDRSAR